MKKRNPKLYGHGLKRHATAEIFVGQQLAVVIATALVGSHFLVTTDCLKDDVLTVAKALNGI